MYAYAEAESAKCLCCFFWESTAAVGKQFVLSDGLPPVPHKLAARILRGEIVDMAELLRYNLEMQRRSSSLPSTQTASAATPAKNRREILDVLSWVQCFGTYMAIITSKYPDNYWPTRPSLYAKPGDAVRRDGWHMTSTSASRSWVMRRQIGRS